MKEARIELKIKNNILYTEIMKRAPNVRQFSKAYGFSEYAVGALLCLRTTPWSKISSNGYRKTPRRLAELFKVLIEDLFPTDLYLIEKSEAVMEVSMEALALSHHPSLMIASPEDAYIDQEAKDEIRQMLSALPSRESAVICDLFGLHEEGDSPMTYREVALKYNVSASRAQQICAKATRRLKTKLGHTGFDRRVSVDGKRDEPYEGFRTRSTDVYSYSFRG